MQIIFNEIIRILVFVWEALIHIWPLLLITIPIAVIMKQFNISDKVDYIFKKNIIVSILIATLLGAVSPFCSCGVIPVISAMLIAGVPIAPVMAFWLASPSMDPEIFFLSVGSLGWPLAIARIVATFLMSIAGGLVTWRLIGNRDTKEFLKTVKNNTSKNNKNNCDEKICDSCGCDDSCSIEEPRYIAIIRSIIESTWFVVRFMLIAYVLEALIIFYVPDEFVVSTLGDNSFLSIFTATLVGIPLYTTNLSALGLMGGLLEKGLSEGAALAFLISGATTTLPAMAAVYKLVNKKIFSIYLLVTLIFAMTSGLVYELISRFF